MPRKGTSAAIGTTIASATPITVSRIRRMSRMIPQYSSAGIWAVFQARPHLGQTQRSPYAT